MVGLVLVPGCTRDPLSPSSDEALYWSNASRSRDSNLKAVEKIFKLQSEGTLAISPGADCANLTQITILGTGNATHLGKFELAIVWCTDFMGTNRLIGTQVDANGDEIYFYAVAFGEDSRGEWTDFVFIGGTGRFTHASGNLRLYNQVTFTSPQLGLYSNSGEGIIRY